MPFARTLPRAATPFTDHAKSCSIGIATWLSPVISTFGPGYLSSEYSATGFVIPSKPGDAGVLPVFRVHETARVAIPATTMDRILMMIIVLFVCF
jgi:hypothetical protein